MELTWYLRVYYILATSCILIVNSSPSVRDRFVKYGARASPQSGRRVGQIVEKAHRNVQRGVISASQGHVLIEMLSDLTVPHSWFCHFYILSVCLSTFWGLQIFSKGYLIERACSWDLSSAAYSMTMPQVFLLWTFMFIQGCRRMLECLALGQKSASRMWIAHWAVGLAFYASISVAVWIEGLTAVCAWDMRVTSALSTAPTIRACVAILVFVFASGIQHDCHVYLASLKKYTIPSHPFFQLVTCPHYTAECLIYLSMAIAGAPKGRPLNNTIVCSLLFVAINLGVTAQGTRRWYADKFGGEVVRGRWTMLPGIW